MEFRRPADRQEPLVSHSRVICGASTAIVTEGVPHSLPLAAASRIAKIGNEVEKPCAIKKELTKDSTPKTYSVTMPEGLEIIPGNELVFELTAKESTPKTTLTLKHPSPNSEAIAFKIKTTQPRRYLVRPNQGLILPGKSEYVQILLVEKDKIALWQSFERLGQTALDTSKDKFLVQCTSVTSSDNLAVGDYEKLSNFWTGVASNAGSRTINNTKLPVKLVAKPDGADGPTARALPKATAGKDPATLSPEQLRSELSNLRVKYDELVSFSVNLTAERDVLNNTLEQTKRELNRYLQKSAAADNKSNSTSSRSFGGKDSAGSPIALVITALLFWMMGCAMQSSGQTKMFSSLPVVGRVFATPVVPMPPPVPAPTPVVETVVTATATESAAETAPAGEL